MEDGRMFFSDGYFWIVLPDGKLCKTTYTAEDFAMVRYKRWDDEIDELNYIVMYMKNGEKLYFYDGCVEYIVEVAWELDREQGPNIKDNALLDYFGTKWKQSDKKHATVSPQDIGVIGYDKAHAEQVKDLLVELQTSLASLDDRGVLVLKENYREDYFAYLMGEIKKHEGKMFLAQGAEGIAGLVVCKIFQGGGEQDITTSCPKIGFISDLVVTEKERGKGIGGALLAAAEKYFAERECVYTQLEVFAPNENARRLYEKFGYQIISFYLSKRNVEQ